MKCSQELKDLLKTLYNFSPSESQILILLCEEKDMRIDEMAEKIGKDRSTVQRYISKLQATDLVKRNSFTTEKGKGRYFRYFLDKENVKNKILDRLENWKKEKEEEIKKL